MIRRILIAGLVAGALLTPRTASAQLTYGVRGGFSTEPSQFLFGGHLETAQLEQQMLKLTLRPNVLIGVGNDQTRLIGSLEVAWWLPMPKSDWSAYVTFGPGLGYTWIKDGDGFSQGLISVGAGFQNSKGVFAELKYQSNQSQIVVGYVLRPRQ